MNRLLISFAFLLLLVACQQPAGKVVLDKKALQAQNVELINQFFTHFNQHEWAKMAAMYTDPADFKDPSFGPGIFSQTREETIEKYAELNAIFPDLHDEVINIYPSGSSHVIVEFVSSGTGPDSSTFTLPVCAIFTIEDGKITRDFTYCDNFEEEEGIE